MNAEAPLIGITNEIISLTESRIENSSQHPESYMSERFRIMHSQQGELVHHLVKYAKGANAGPSYFLGAIITHEMIPQNQKFSPLSQNHIHSAFATLIDFMLEPQPDTQWESRHEWFAKLAKDSPPYIQWLITTSQKYDPNHIKGQFVIGGLFVFTPFYMREEARQLERSLYK